MMKIFIVLCLASLAIANKHEMLADQELARAKIALDELTFTKEEHIYNVDGYVEGEKEIGYENEIDDPCANMECRIGRECVLDNQREPFCDCATSCPQGETSEDAIHRTKVCTTTNATFTNLCEFHRQKCMEVDLMEVHVDYYGECAEMGSCSAEDLREYPERMTNWFIKSLALIRNRPEEHGGLSQKEKETLQQEWSQSTHAIFWKFDRLDKNPSDHYLDFAELEGLRAPIVLFEPCTKPFLQACDVDNDTLISAVEFGRCLNLSDEQVPY
ncbi:secreted protein, acidic, cysteine-rich precursor [Strongylocentrotus purpuratus]|uniref:Osteonectin n=1 Tax=Strongylocentrotus purpuratus TaxID=7668 RepID=A0MT19_STRPU|nr:secreted protein, acidic, cysteine-rich precursor [Strongylocentrotus purpuratus]ABK33665.1 osteonectin [Strongylocentrotus purpuratus]BAF56044.1 SPARC [Strongylocentrotus purpuratus]|eukprot:NP_001091924.1 secreted protein, acidic, cysteine-rich precursor [Strongylocentrotus purpuratus]